MNTPEFKEELKNQISCLEDLIHSMPYKGDSEEESQKVCLQNRLNDFYYTVNGIEDSDLEE